MSGSGGQGKRSQVAMGVALVVISAACYALHYLFFRDLHHILIYLVGDVAFVFLEVLLVTLVIHALLEQRERGARLNKLNVVIGAFFSEMGTRLIAMLAEADPAAQASRDRLVVRQDWGPREFAAAARWLSTCDYAPELDAALAEALRDFLSGQRDFLLRLLENPNLLEHESFTEMLRGVFHMSEELGVRESLHGLPDVDLKHLAGDMRRVYLHLVPQWLDYMLHLKVSYPYLFSLAMRLNPFDEAASPVVSGEPAPALAQQARAVAPKA